MNFWDAPPAAMDWNGDGKIDWMDAGIETGVIMQINDDIQREDRITRMVRAITALGECTIGNAEFEELCRQEGLRMSDFEQWDIDEIQRRLDRY